MYIVRNTYNLISSVSDPNNSVHLPVYYLLQPHRRCSIAPMKLSFKYRAYGWLMTGLD